MQVTEAMDTTTKPENPNRIRDLEAENAELRRQLAERAESDRQRDADEQIITEKMRVGLTRAQAVSVIRRQREFDAGKAEAKADRLKKLAGILTGRESMAEAMGRTGNVFPDHFSPTVRRAEVEEALRGKRAK
jgi:hypothetical protein